MINAKIPGDGMDFPVNVKKEKRANMMLRIMWFSQRIRSGIRNVIRAPRWWYQRARRGYSDKDMWNADRYIAGIFAGTLDWFVYKGQSISAEYHCPPNLDDLDKAIIRRYAEYLYHSRIFQEYCKNGPAFDEQWKKEFGGVLDKDLQHSLQWISQHFTELWD